MDDKKLLQKLTEAVIDLNQRVEVLEKKAAAPEGESDTGEDLRNE